MHLYPSSPYKEQTCSTYFYTNLQIWHTMNKIRLLTKDELPKAIELSWQVFTITSKEDFNDEGLEFFKSFIYNEKYIDEITFYGSFNNKVLTGILGIKNNGKHISLFFIKPEYHRQGLGKTLFHYVFALHPSIETTVNSSTYAIPFLPESGICCRRRKTKLPRTLQHPHETLSCCICTKAKVHTTYLANRRRSFISSRTE